MVSDQVVTKSGIGRNVRTVSRFRGVSAGLRLAGRNDGPRGVSGSSANIEWTDIEFKEVARIAHQSACETVSTFANTGLAGG